MRQRIRIWEMGLKDTVLPVPNGERRRPLRASVARQGPRPSHVPVSIGTTKVVPFQTFEEVFQPLLMFHGLLQNALAPRLQDEFPDSFAVEHWPHLVKDSFRVGLPPTVEVS